MNTETRITMNDIVVCHAYLMKELNKLTPERSENYSDRLNMINCDLFIISKLMSRGTFDYEEPSDVNALFRVHGDILELIDDIEQDN